MKIPERTPTPPDAPARRTSPLAGLALLLFLFFGLLSSGHLISVQGLITAPASRQLFSTLHGAITQGWARQLADAQMPTVFARIERGAGWWLFGDLGPRVRQGCPGWLFLSDELAIDPQAQAHADQKAAAVIDLNQQLSRRGVQLLVVIVPDKTRIAAAQRCALPRPAVLDARIRQWAAQLDRHGVHTLDLTAVLSPLGANAFWRTDTHWNERGAQAAAEAISARFIALKLTALPRQAFDLQNVAPALRPGDLVHLAGLDDLPLNLQPTPERATRSVVSPRDEGSTPAPVSLGALLGDDDLPDTALVGTSFSRNSNFAGFLQRALGAPIGPFALDGGGFSGAMNAYLKSPAFKASTVRQIIWEIPERDLQSAYNQAIGFR
ncbi:MAG: cell division protein FtsQ [Pseudomonas sp.]|nr:cell division protein FtsQ [Pseudomonas sp.]